MMESEAKLGGVDMTGSLNLLWNEDVGFIRMDPYGYLYGNDQMKKRVLIRNVP